MNLYIELCAVQHAYWCVAETAWLDWKPLTSSREFDYTRYGLLHLKADHDVK